MEYLARGNTPRHFFHLIRPQGTLVRNIDILFVATYIEEQIMLQVFSLYKDFSYKEMKRV